MVPAQKVARQNIITTILFSLGILKMLNDSSPSFWAVLHTSLLKTAAVSLDSFILHTSMVQSVVYNNSRPRGKYSFILSLQRSSRLNKDTIHHLRQRNFSLSCETDKTPNCYVLMSSGCSPCKDSFIWYLM